MQLDGYVRDVAQQLTAAAALGDDRVREIATALATAAGPAVRLAILVRGGGRRDHRGAARQSGLTRGRGSPGC